MPINVTCPGCKNAFAFSDQLAGRAARCLNCDYPFHVKGPAGGKEVPPPRPKKKKGSRRDVDPSVAMAWKLAIGLGVGLLLLMAGGITLALVFLGGPRPDPGPNLVGKWVGAADLDASFDEATGGAKIPSFARDFTKGILRKAATKLLGIDVVFKENGKVFFTGETQALGLKPNSDGTWEILARDADILQVRLDPGGAPFEARLAFRDKDSFVMSRGDRKEAPAILFTRLKE